jgi:hypothetical protein
MASLEKDANIKIADGRKPKRAAPGTCVLSRKFQFLRVC